MRENASLFEPSLNSYQAILGRLAGSSIGQTVSPACDVECRCAECHCDCAECTANCDSTPEDSCSDNDSQ